MPREFNLELDPSVDKIFDETPGNSFLAVRKLRWNQNSEFKLDINREIHKEALVKAITDYKLDDKFKASVYAKKIERRQKRANLTDFDRFKVMRLRQKRAAIKGKILKAKK